MAAEDISIRVLKYLKRKKKENTFRLSRELGIDRSTLFDIIRALKEKKAVEFDSGVVKFLKIPRKEEPLRKSRPLKEETPKLNKEVELETKAEAQAKHIERLEKTIEELKRASATPKIIKKIIIKKFPKKLKLRKREKKKGFKLKFNKKHLKKISKIAQNSLRIVASKINFTRLGKNIQQLHVPGLFKKT